MIKHILVFILCVGNLSAATYYIDYAGGSDSNNGTAKATPWKHVPVMAPFSGSYTHVDGDRFIFKGGVIWPRAALPLRILTGGAAGNFDYYGVDATWFTGGSWARPIFDGGAASFSNHSANQGNVIEIVGTQSYYVTIESIEIRNWIVKNINPSGSAFDEHAVFVENSSHVHLNDLYIHDWVMGYKGDGQFGGPGSYTPAPLGLVDLEIRNSIIRAPATIPDIYRGELLPDSHGTGVGVEGFSLVENCDISGTSEGLWDCVIQRNNVIHNIRPSTSPTLHENGVRFFGGAEFYNNILYDIHAVGFFANPGWGGATSSDVFIYNNVFFDLAQINLSQEQSGTPNTNQVWFVNNTVVNQVVNIGRKATAPDFGGPVVISNNLFVNNTSSSVNVNDPIANLKVINNNIITTTAASAIGMTAANFYKPTQFGTLNTGLNFTSGNPAGASPAGTPNLNFNFDFNNLGRPSSGAWTMGPYQGSGTVVIPGNIQLTASTFQTIEGTNAVITASRGGGDDGVVGVSWATSNTSPVSATAGTDYTAATGTFSWANNDTANKSATITVAQDAAVEGSESFLFTISSPTGGATLATPTQAIVTINDDDAAPTIPLMPSLTFNVASMFIEPPFVNTGGLIDQPVQTTTPSAGGRALADVTIPTTGNYRVVMNVVANTSSSDSLFIDFDTEPTTPTTIWDVLPATIGSAPQARNVSWRGTGAFNAPQFVDKEWTLTSGVHRLYLRGREANMDLQSVTIFPVTTVDTTPPNPNPPSIVDVGLSSVSVTIETDPAVDITGPVKYRFEVIGPAPNGPTFDTGFQDQPAVNLSLYPGKAYSVRVQTQDGVSPPNVSDWSEPVSLEVPTIEGAGATNPFTPKVKAEGSERSSFFLSNSFYGPGAYTDPAAAQNWTNGMVNMFAFYPPVDAGMTTFITSRNAGFMFYQNGATRPGGTSAATIAANSVDAGVLCTTVGKDRSLWNLMAEWDQSGGGWVSEGRPSYIGQTRVAAHGLFTDYYLTNSPPLGTYLALPQTERPWRLASVSDSSQNTFIAFQMGIDIGLLERAIDELGDTSTGLAYARGAGRLYGKPWGIDISTWRTSADSATEFNGSGQHTGGWTPSYLRRHIYTAYMGGAHIIEIEPTIYYLTGTTLNPFGTMTDAFADFSLTRHPYNTIGASVVPMALIFDYYSGFDTKHGLFNQYNAVWYGDIPYSSGDYMINNFFKVAYPNHWLHGTTPGAPWSDAAGYQAFLAGGGDARPYEPMPTTRWGDTMDVTLNTATADKLSRYSIVTLMGGVTIDTNLRAALTAFATAGGTVVVNASQVTSADESLLGVTLGGSPVSGGNSTWTETSTTYTEAAYLYKPVTPTTATVLATTTGAAPLITSNVVGSGRVILTTPSYLQETDNSDLLLIGTRLFDELYADVLPAVVSSPAVQYMFNQSPGKLITTIVNSSGSTWAGTITALISGTITAVKEYIADTAYGSYTNVGGVVTITGSVPAYDIKIYAIEFTP